MKIKRFKGDIIVYYICAVVMLALGVVLMPVITDLGLDVLNYVMAGGILLYLFG